MTNEKEYNIGDRVFWAHVRGEEVSKKCIVCYGDRTVKVTLGNGEIVVVDCDYCEKGFERARGYTTEFEYKSDVQEIILDGKEVSENSEGKSIEYRLGNIILRVGESIFDTAEEAEKRVKEIVKKHDEEVIERGYYSKNQKVKSLGWKIGYHKRCAKQAKEEFERHSKQVQVLSSLAMGK